MSEEKQIHELTQQEQEEVTKLFADFASRHWSDPQEESTENEEAPEETAEESEDMPEEAPAESPPAKKRLSKKGLIAIAVSAILCIGLICLTVYVLCRNEQPQPVRQMTLSASRYYVTALTEDGTAQSIKLEQPIYSVDYVFSGIDIQDVSDWTGIVSVSTGTYHTLGLKDDGTVLSTGIHDSAENVIPYISHSSAAPEMPDLGQTAENVIPYISHSSAAPEMPDLGQTAVDDWTDIVAVSAGHKHSVGLRSDGTVVAVGDDHCGQCQVDKWTDIIAISAGANHTVGLKRDGTVVSTRIPEGVLDPGLSGVETWTDIVAISAGTNYTLGVRNDGTVVAAGENGRGQCNVATWTDIVSVAAGSWHSAGLRKDGTVVCTDIRTSFVDSVILDFGQTNVDTWENIVAVEATEQHTLGLTSQGTVVVAGGNSDATYDISKWSSIQLP